MKTSRFSRKRESGCRKKCQIKNSRSQDSQHVAGQSECHHNVAQCDSYDLEISFERHDARFNEGEVAKGHVSLDITENLMLEDLTIEFSGTATVQNIKPPRGQQSTNKDGKEVEKHLNQKLTLYSRANDSSEDKILTVGRHQYPFQIQLPFGLPSSFVGDYGSISYMAIATVHQLWHPTFTKSREFNISSIVNLNAIPNITMPVHCHKSTSGGERAAILCLPVTCHEENVAMVWRLGRTGYIPGEKIPINGEIHNNGRTKIRKSKALLIQHVQYFDMWAQSVLERKQVALVEKGSIKGGLIGFWREEMEVPPLPPTGLKGCNMINLWYTLKFKVVPSGIQPPLETSVEVTIGTVPLSGRATDTPLAGTMADNYDSSLANSATQLDTVEDYNYFI